jgi:RimJ/RimL family protein N-acetyltransferase
LRLLAGWAGQQADVRQVTARTLVDNEPSKALLAQAGFAEVGRDANLISYRWTPALVPRVNEMSRDS